MQQSFKAALRTIANVGFLSEDHIGLIKARALEILREQPHLDNVVAGNVWMSQAVAARELADSGRIGPRQFRHGRPRHVRAANYRSYAVAVG